MAKILIAGNQAVIKSSIKTSDIKLLQKRNPDALALKDEEKNVIFAVGVGDKGGISQYGIVFNGTAPDGTGCAVISEQIPANVTTEEGVKEWVLDKIGLSIVKLNQVEDQLVEGLAKVEAENASVQENITFVGGEA